MAETRRLVHVYSKKLPVPADIRADVTFGLSSVTPMLLFGRVR
jgi:hypothetical protein